MMRLYVARREKNANVGLLYEGVTVERNVRYGERKYQTFSLYRKSERTLPIVINFHGGGVVGRTKNSRRAFCVSIARELDVAVMNVEYRGETSLGARACLEEVEKLFPYLKESAKSLALDVDKVFLVGDGIGAYLASYLATVAPALEKAEQNGCPAIAIELSDGTILTSRDKNNLYAPAGVIMNAIKYLTGIDDGVDLIAPNAIEAILKLKKENLKAKSNKINLEEALIALSFSAATNPVVEKALNELNMLVGCEAHSTVMLPESSLKIFRRLGINITCEPIFAF